MPVPKHISREQAVVRGLQEFLVIDVAPAGAASLLGAYLKDAGLLNVAGLYECHVDAEGLSNVLVTVTPTSVTGTFAPSFYSTYANKTTARTTATGAVNFANATAQTLTVALAGEHRCILAFTIPGGGAVNFTTRAEANGL